MNTIPYDEFDPPIVPLARTLNGLPGIRTLSSCGGHEEPTNASAATAEHWYVSFELAPANEQAFVRTPTPEAWLTLEFLAWEISDHRRAARSVELGPIAHPPWLNRPGRMLQFQIDGWRDGDGGIEPDDLADAIERHVGSGFLFSPDEVSEFEAET